jgi:ketol-acid reductoisomerase
MPNRYYEKDGNLDFLKDQTVAIIGYGSQGHAHALNLRDSGMDVCVGLRKDSPSWEKAAKQGLPVFETAEAARRADIVMMLVPDEMGSEIYEAEVAPQLTPGKYLAFGHGFNIHFKKIVPPADVNVFMIAPKGPGHLVRSEFEKGGGVPCLLAVFQNPSGKARDIGLAWARGIGGASRLKLDGNDDLRSFRPESRNGMA